MLNVLVVVSQQQKQISNYSYINLGISVVKCGDCKTNMMVYRVYGINNVNTLCRY